MTHIFTVYNWTSLPWPKWITDWHVLMVDMGVYSTSAVSDNSWRLVKKRSHSPTAGRPLHRVRTSSTPLESSGPSASLSSWWASLPGPPRLRTWEEVGGQTDASRGRCRTHDNLRSNLEKSHLLICFIICTSANYCVGLHQDTDLICFKCTFTIKNLLQFNTSI